MTLFSRKNKQNHADSDDHIPAGASSLPPRPAPAYKNMNNYILIVLDSLRFDTVLEARLEFIPKLGTLEKRYSYASWTAPSHYNLLMGLLPHSSPANVYASEYYKNDFIKFNERFGATGFEFKKLVPQLYLPVFMRNKLGYKTHALTSLPVLNPRTPLNTGFDKFKLMDRHNDMNSMLDEMSFSEQFPSFYLLNVGETHYPYATPEEPENEWPKISGVHGVFKHLDDHIVGGKLMESSEPEKFFDQVKLDQLRNRQIHALEYLDSIFEKLYDLLPTNSYVTVTSDHGELFGEAGYFGHGPIMHEKVFEVPFWEGKLK